MVKLHLLNILKVAPFAGAWIEIEDMEEIASDLYSRTLRGCVD